MNRAYSYILHLGIHREIEFMFFFGKLVYHTDLLNHVRTENCDSGREIWKNRAPRIMFAL